MNISPWAFSRALNYALFMSRDTGDRFDALPCSVINVIICDIC